MEDCLIEHVDGGTVAHTLSQQYCRLDGALRSPLEIFRLEKQIIFLAPKCASSPHR